MNSELLLTDGNRNPIPVSAKFTTEEVELTGTAFTDNDVDVPANAVEAILVSDASFEIAEKVNGDGYPVQADTDIMLGVANMSKIWLKGANEQDVHIMWRFL